MKTLSIIISIILTPAYIVVRYTMGENAFTRAWERDIESFGLPY